MIARALRELAHGVTALPRTVKRLIVVFLDSCLCILSVWLAYYLRIGEFVSFSPDSPWGEGAIWASAAAIFLAIPIFLVNGLYRAVFRYSGLPAMLAVGRATAEYGILYAILFTVIGMAGIPRTIGIIQPILLLLFVGTSRATARMWLGEQYLHMRRASSRSRALIYGAGIAGRQLAAAMSYGQDVHIVGFVDDDPKLHGQLLNGRPVYGPSNLSDLASDLNIGHILLAMPELPRRRRNEILNSIRSAHVVVRTLPSVADLVRGTVNVSDLRELDIDDLLGRDPVVPDQILLEKNIRGKIVLVTGAGGSIGSELCRQIISVGPSVLLLVEQSEFSLYTIHQELESGGRDALIDESGPMIIPLLASVQDRRRMNEIMALWRPHTVYHAAAYKHVPLVEHNQEAGVSNNVFGTLHTAQAAIRSGVSDFVLISTDKAVRPTNMMGASKRLAEMTLQALAAERGATNFTIVRFGNVLGSSGSVVPKFRQQIREGGPITITHPDITRYFMTIPEAAQLVIQAGAMSVGNDVFVLDMGAPIRIIDLARRMLELSGCTIRDGSNPTGDIAIEVTGLRPGEKLYEELLIGDNPQPTRHPRIMKAHEEFIPWSVLEGELEALSDALQRNNASDIRQLMQHLVKGYGPMGELVDWVHLQKASKSTAGLPLR